MPSVTAFQRLATLLFLYQTYHCCCCWAILEAAVILPHGDFAYDPDLAQQNNGDFHAAQRLAAASRHVGHDFLEKTVQPDVIFVISPHGMALSRDFGLYVGRQASGYVDIGNDLHPPHGTYRVHLNHVPLSPTLSLDLVKALSAFNVSAIQVSADNSRNTPLAWAEVIPLLLVNETVRRPHLIWSQPLRRLGPAAGADMVNELLNMGNALFRWIQDRPERLAVLVSADLSHTHRPDGPYGYAPAAQAFDDSIQQWATGNPCNNAKYLLEMATLLQPHALSCGYTGMVMLHGLLCGTHHDIDYHDDDLPKWESQVLVNTNVTYYGMMVAAMRRVKQRKSLRSVD